MAVSLVMRMPGWLVQPSTRLNHRPHDTSQTVLDPALGRALVVGQLEIPTAFCYLIGVGRAYAPPPSEPDRRVSRIRLSGWWYRLEEG
jgi:hypothetical protein